MAAGTGRFTSRAFCFAYGPSASSYSGLVAIPLGLVAILGFFSMALLLALLLAAAVIVFVARRFRAWRLPVRETAALPHHRLGKSFNV